MTVGGTDDSHMAIGISSTELDNIFVIKTRTITATAPITIAGTTSADLSADRTIAIVPATTSVPGSMSAADKTKLDGLTTGGSVSIQIDQSGGTSDTYGVLAGSVNGSNKVYTVSLSKYVSGSLVVYLNGQLQTQGTGEDWVETTPASGTFTFAIAPPTGSQLTVRYQFAAATTGNADMLDGLHASAFALVGSIPAATGVILSDQLLGADAPTIDFTSIPSTYNHLKIVFVGRSTEATTWNYAFGRFNNDSGNNYYNQYATLTGDGASSNVEGLAQDKGRVGNVPAGSATAGHAGTSEILIPFYKDTTFKKTLQFYSFAGQKLTSGGPKVSHGGFLWNDATAISRVTLVLASGNYLEGTHAILYGYL